MKKIDEKRNALRAPLDKELEELAEQMIPSSAPEKQAQISRAQVGFFGF